MAAFQALSRHAGSNFSLLNQALLTMLPKKHDAQEPGDYRPISLLHNFAKIFSKVLARRLVPELTTLVATNQSAFTKGRSIQDNFLLVRQSTHFLHQQK